MTLRFLAPLVLLGLISSEASANAVSGSWTANYRWPFIPIHAVNLPDGRVMTYGANDGYQGGQISYDIWDPSLGLGPGAHLTLPNTTAVDTFCSATLLMPQTGNVLTLSGDSNGPRNSLIRNQDVTSYDYRSDTVRRLDRGINRQRWYGTPVMTAKGEIFLQAGTCWGVSEGACPETLGIIPEIYRPGSGWSYLSNISGSVAENAFGESGGMKQWWYPRSWLMGNGQIYTLSGGRVQVTMSTEGAGSIVQHETLNGDNFGATNSGVMYQPDKLLITGGGGIDSNGKEPAGRRQATLIDLTTGAPRKTVAQPMSAGRQWHNSTVLPDGKVLVTGGSTVNNSVELVTNTAEIWDPALDTWTIGAEGPIPRLYHSVALLLQDGRVFTGGGGAPGPRKGTDGEVYSPPYLFKPGMQNRLSISAGPSVVESSRNYTLTVSDANRVNRVTMVGYGGATHSFNVGQRFVELDFNVQANGTVQITTPSNPNHIPPGYYMIFVLDAGGVPSVAHTVRVFSSSVVASPDQEIQSPPPPVTGPQWTSCQALSNARGIGYEATWGTATPEDRTWFETYNCKTLPRTSPVPLQPPGGLWPSCQVLSDTLGTTNDVTWGAATQEDIDWWYDNGCRTSPTATALWSSCQELSNTRGTDHGVTWGSATSEDRDWWIANSCRTTPAATALWSSCQELSNTRGTDHNVTWGSATSEDRDWWIANSCRTTPAATALWSSCQELSNTRGTNHNVTWGSATSQDRDWWIANSCSTAPLGAASDAQKQVRVGAVDFGIIIALFGLLGVRNRYHATKK